MSEIALLGTGRMGHELALHLLAAGHRLRAWNRTPSGADSTVAAGATRCATAAEAVNGADVVISCLFGPQAVDEAIVGPQLIQPGQIWLDVTTVGPFDAQCTAAWAADSGLHYVYGPVVGSLAPARAGKLGTFLGGKSTDIDTVTPLVRLWSDPDRITEFRTGIDTTNGPRDAAVAKLLANLALAISLEGLREALQFGKSQGFSEAAVLKILSGTALGWIADFKAPMINMRDYTDTQFSVDLLVKDIGLMYAAGGTEYPALNAALDALRESQANGDGDADIAAVMKSSSDRRQREAR